VHKLWNYHPKHVFKQPVTSLSSIMVLEAIFSTVERKGGHRLDWAGFACFLQPVSQWTGLKIKICNPHSEWSTRWTLGSADRDGFGYFFFYGPKTRKIIHNLVNPIQNLKIPIESTLPANNNKKKELELPTNLTVNNFFILLCDCRLNEYVYVRM